ncbi:DNA internalization-related competence protein ComEC/Rec2 [Aeromicrobium terrae]|uniref:DNA internalization-related competence protein ComEC/Rec2 n=1 Tax=Aeromicrobium terrae TaxID=2498846 RepID=A0A5C8NJC2_9ACTN|nr:DNA internalization-related competence protein ComEC/Rec2 [Aeromicrobium terrae]TXL61849.1 DNA internalization-related competence protein ComEC/Rec2 [Aeromicrobium terrae]
MLVATSSVLAVAVALVAIALAGACVGRWPRVAVVAVCVGLVAASCAWRLADSGASPLRDAAAHHRTAALDVRVTRDARVFTRFGSDSAAVGVRVLRATVDGRSYGVGDAATAFVDGSARDLVVGRRLTMVGRLASAESTTEVATIDVVRRSSVRGAAWWWEASQRVRTGVRHAVAHTGRDPAALVPALVDGDDAAVSDRMREDFRRSGLTHLMAVSGTNLTIVLAVVLVLARSAGVRRAGLIVLGGLAVVAFVLLARPDPSVVRAAGMGVVGLAALGLGSRGGLRALAVAIIALLVVDPTLSRSVGFVLSVCATAGILVGTRPLAGRLGRWMPRWCALAVAVPIAAQLACTPALAAISGQVSLVAVPANVLAGPLVAPATVAGLAGGLLDVVSPPLARVPGTVAGWCAAAIVAIAHHAAALAGASIAWRGPWWLLLLVVPVVFVLVWRLSARPAVVLGLMLGLAVGMWRPPQVGWPPEGWLMVACDVGQGDATVIDAGGGAALVVDAGPDPAPVDRCLDRLHVKRIPVAVVTHAHADHAGGWSGLVDDRPVGRVLVGPSGGPRGWHGVVSAVSTGDGFAVGRLDVEVLWPPAGAAPPDRSDGSAMNDASVVLRVTVGATRLLLSGDLEPDAQDELLRLHPDVAADVMKMPHHGSSRQSDGFFDAVGARIATISAGEGNDYGHPAAAALHLLREHGVAWWRTDTDGDVAIVRRAGHLRVVTQH